MNVLLQHLVILPVVVPLVAGAAMLFLAEHRRKARVTLALVSMLVQLLVGITLLYLTSDAAPFIWPEGVGVYAVGNWPAPFGIVLVVDRLSAVMITLSATVALSTLVYAIARWDRPGQPFHSLFQLQTMGLNGAFLTGDLFNLYVWFEVMLIASFVLMALYRTGTQLRAAFTYVTLNLLASALLLTAIGLLYGQAGTLNFADLAQVWPQRQTPALDEAIAMLFVIAFGIKAGLFPLFFWLPASYHAPPAAIGALFAGLLTKVGVYALIRVFTLLFRNAAGGMYSVILVLSVTTMVVGMTAAVGQRDFRRVLSFNLVGHIGFTTVGLALSTPFAVAASIFYMLHHMVVITSLFLVSGLFLRLRRTTDLAALGGLYRTHPATAVLTMIPIFSLAGVPPLSGFIAKLAIIEASLEIDYYWLAAVVLAVSLLTLLSMARLWSDAFWKPAPPGATDARLGPAMLASIAVLAAVTLGLTFAAEPVFSLCSRAAEQLLHPDEYVRAVLGGG